MGKTGGLSGLLVYLKEQASGHLDSKKRRNLHFPGTIWTGHICTTQYPACLEVKVDTLGFHCISKRLERLNFLSGVSGGGEAKISPQHEAATRMMAWCQNPFIGPRFGRVFQKLGPLVGTGRLQWTSPDPAATRCHVTR